MTAAATPSTIESDLPCAGCEYNLRGLPADGKCPECGEAVERASRGETLHHADPTWLKRLIVAGWLILAGFVVGLFIDLASMLILSRLVSFGDPVYWITNVLLSVGTAGVLAAGPFVWLSPPEPARFDDRRRLRLTAKSLVIATFLLSLLDLAAFVAATLLLTTASGSTTDAYSVVVNTGYAISAITTAGVGIAASLTCLYAAAVLRRLPSRLPAWFRGTGILIAPGFAVVAGMTVWMQVTRSFTAGSHPVWLALSAFVLLTATCGWLLATALFGLSAWRLAAVRKVARRMRVPRPGC